MHPEPREFATAAEIIANRKAVRARLRSLPAYVDPNPPPAPEPEPEPEPEPVIEAAPQPEPLPPPPEPDPLAFVWRPASGVRIIMMVATHYSLTRAELSSTSRILHYIQPRQIAMYLCVRYAAMSTPAVGRLFGGRDHTTVLHAVRKTTERIQVDAQCAAEVAEFVRQIEAW